MPMSITLVIEFAIDGEGNAQALIDVVLRSDIQGAGRNSGLCNLCGQIGIALQAAP